MWLEKKLSLKSAKRNLYVARLSLVLSFISISVQPALAADVVIDALAPGSVVNCASPISGSYGNTVIAGNTGSITQIDFVVNSTSAIPANTFRVKVSTGAPASTTGTIIGTFSQSSVASYPADGSNYYLVSFTGAASVTSGTTYYIQISYVSSGSGHALCVSGNSYSTLNGWNFAKSGSSYIDVYSSGTFNFSYFHKFKLTTGIMETSVAFSNFSMLNNSRSATYRSEISITANVTTHSKVTFFANGKRIPNCVNVQTVGTLPNIVASCYWKPSNRGSVVLYSQAVPNNVALSSATSTSINVVIASRSSTR